MNNVVELHQTPVIAGLIEVRRQFRKLFYVFAHARFVQQLAQAIEISTRCSRTFERHITFSTSEGARLLEGRYQADICELWDAIYEDNVGRLNVPVDEPVAVKLTEGRDQRFAKLQTFVQRKSSSNSQITSQRPGHVIVRITRLPLPHVISRFHHIVEVAIFFISTDVQDTDPAGIAAGNRFKFLQTGKLAI